MKYLLRPYISLGFVVLVGAGVAMMPPCAAAQGAEITQILQEPSPLILGSSTSQGYLGVDFVDVDQDKAQTLKLKDVRGAVITLIDHDAPAGQIGLRVNDVVIQLNGQTVEGAEQLKRMLKEIPPGHKVSIEISRDGNVQTLAVELVDHKVLGHDVWNKIGNGGDVFAQSTPALGILTGEGDASLPGAFRMSIFGSTLNVGAFVEPLTSQMAEYLGVPSGLMVKQVARKSEAAAAGLKAFDVILKVGPDAVTNLAGWDRALRANQGKPVQVTILRDRKQQTLTLQVDSKHKTGELEQEEIFPAGDGAMVAEVDPDSKQMFGWNDAPAAEALREQAEAIKDRVQEMVQSEIGSQETEELRKQAEKIRDSIKGENFKGFTMDQKQMDELKRQMEEFSKNFKAEDFKVDPKQMEELKRQMKEWQKNFKADELQTAPY
jgi:membrane-associated protease RseP (regulator of RpoE activity)